MPQLIVRRKLKKIPLVFTTLVIFLLYVCTDKPEQSNQVYERQDFDEQMRTALENENFSITEYWEHASHIEPIPKEVEVLHQAIADEGKAQRSTAYLIAESKEKGTVSIQYWILEDQVGAVRISSPDESGSEKIKAELLRRLPDITVLTEMEGLIG